MGGGEGLGREGTLRASGMSHLGKNLVFLDASCLWGSSASHSPDLLISWCHLPHGGLCT